jgi:hypothetical protein
MATTLGGSVERPVPQGKDPAPASARVPVAVPSAIPEGETITNGARQKKQAKRDDSQSRESKPPGETNVSEPPALPAGPGSSLGQELEQTVGTLPLGSEVTDTLPVDTATRLIDETLDDVDQTVEDVTELLP